MKVLAIDYGKRRIGLALGDTNLRIAVPIGSIENRNQKTFEEISQKVREHGISIILLGLPLTPSGRERIRGFLICLLYIKAKPFQRLMFHRLFLQFFYPV